MAWTTDEWLLTRPDTEAAVADHEFQIVMKRSLTTSPRPTAQIEMEIQQKEHEARRHGPTTHVNLFKSMCFC